MKNNPENNPRFDWLMKLDFWLLSVFSTLFCGIMLIVGLALILITADQAGVNDWGFWLGLLLAISGLTGLVFTCRKFMRGPVTIKSLESRAEKLRDERLQAIDQLLAQSPPRSQIPKGFQGANLVPKYATAIGALLLGMFPGWLIFFAISYFTSDDIDLNEAGFFQLLYGAATAIMYILASILWVAFLWLRISERLRRRKILRDGRLVDGRVATVKSCGQWEKVLFSPPDGTGTQSRALLEFPWEGETRQAHQFVYDNDENTSFRSVPVGTPVRLLVHPLDPRHVIWVEATFLPDPLRNTAIPESRVLTD